MQKAVDAALVHPRTVRALAFAAEANRVAAGCLDGGLRFHPVPQRVLEPTALLIPRLEAATGLQLDPSGAIVVLDSPQYRAAPERLPGEAASLRSGVISTIHCEPESPDCG
jgi:hypothetical protein